MQEISRKEYINNVVDYEKLYLILVDDDKVYLRADIENEENLRIEIMDFEMDTSLNFLESNSDSRNCGRKIYFIEYDSYEMAEKNIVKDFMNLYENCEIVYLLCREDDLKNILQKYKNKSIYVITE